METIYDSLLFITWCLVISGVFVSGYLGRMLIYIYRRREKIRRNDKFTQFVSFVLTSGLSAVGFYYPDIMLSYSTTAAPVLCMIGIILFAIAERTRKNFVRVKALLP